MSAIEEALKRAETAASAAPEVRPAPGWGWLPNLLMFVLLAVVLWNYLSEREYRRQMETRLEAAVSDLGRARADLERVERQSRQMEDLLHAELEAANGRITKMKFDLDTLRRERDSADSALSEAQSRIETLSFQNRRLHGVIQSLRRRPKPALSGSVSWEPPAGT